MFQLSLSKKMSWNVPWKNYRIIFWKVNFSSFFKANLKNNITSPSDVISVFIWSIDLFSQANIFLDMAFPEAIPEFYDWYVFQRFFRNMMIEIWLEFLNIENKWWITKKISKNCSWTLIQKKGLGWLPSRDKAFFVFLVFSPFWNIVMTRKRWSKCFSTPVLKKQLKRLCPYRR